MAMNVGSGSATSDREVMMDINTAPLIDVMLVLLVMLIITIPIQLHAVNLNMPTGNPPPPLTIPEGLKVDIDDVGTVCGNGVVTRTGPHQDRDRRQRTVHRRIGEGGHFREAAGVKFTWITHGNKEI